MEQISGVDLRHLLSTLRRIEGAHVDKVYQQGDSFFWRVRKLGEERRILAIVLPSAVFFTEEKPKMGEPSAFCQKLRSLIEKTIILKIEQVGLERVLKITLSAKAGTRIVYLELFSKGNLIVCDAQGKIIIPFKSQTWKDRTLKRGEVYLPPPKRETPEDMAKEEWVAKLTTGFERNISTFLATKVGLGGEWAAKICAACGIDPKQKQVDENQAAALYDEILRLLEEGDGERIQQQLSDQWGAQIRAAPTKQDPRVKKARAIVEQQEMAIKNLQKKADEATKRAEAIFGDYQRISTLLSTAKERGLDAVADDPLVKKLDKKSKTITVDIGEGGQKEDEM